ncbi:MAG: hypothetical protein ACMXYF_03675 [Candidatus Woesearchaeota archaeon]
MELLDGYYPGYVLPKPQNGQMNPTLTELTQSEWKKLRTEVGAAWKAGDYRGAVDVLDELHFEYRGTEGVAFIDRTVKAVERARAYATGVYAR